MSLTRCALLLVTLLVTGVLAPLDVGAADEPRKGIDPGANGPARVEALIEEARQHAAQGFRRKSLPLLQEAARAAASQGPEVQAKAHLAFGSMLHQLGAYPESMAVFTEALALPGITAQQKAQLRMELAVVHGALGDVKEAVGQFREAETLASQSGTPLLRAQIAANLARTLITAGRVRELESALQRADALQGQVPDSDAKAELLISLAALYRSAYWYFDFESQWIVRAMERLQQAGAIAEALADQRLLSYAEGHLGRLYEDDGAVQTALRLSRQAAFHANAVESYESAYLWEWQIGRILNRQGEGPAAIAAYEQAIETLEYVRQDLIDGSPYSFHQKVQPLFTELSDILLRRARLANGADLQVQLRNVQNILEQVKSAELQDYFQNECVLPEVSVELDQVEKGTATVYPILLDDRIEILVSVNGTIYQYTSIIQRAAFDDLVNEFRDNLQIDQGDDEYLEIAQEIYELIIAPFASLLAENAVKTLLFVPDGVLRTVPIAALHDGESWLIEQYAVATTPGLKLTLPRPLELTEASVFAGGISDSVQGFSSLPGVPTELLNLASNYGASVIQNSAFSLEKVTEQMADNSYSIVHIATHGHFDSNPEKSFLLAYDDKLTMNLLEQSIGFRKVLGNPLELLVLSACESAAGDNRAALGLAGVALKAGARSAVATLWQISDAATVKLIGEFYAQAADGEQTKAAALRHAQMALINSGRFEHPSDWAPFLLIGNWL